MLRPCLLVLAAGALFAASALEPGVYAGKWSGCCFDGKFEMKLDKSAAGVKAVEFILIRHREPVAAPVRRFEASGDRVVIEVEYDRGDEEDPLRTVFTGERKANRLEGTFVTRWLKSGVGEDEGKWSAELRH